MQDNKDYTAHLQNVSRPLRVLVVLPMYGGSLPIGRYCCQGLKELGHMVETFEAPGFYSAFLALKDLRVGINRLEYLENSFLQVVSQAILAKVEAFEPDLVLALAQAPLSRQALKRLSKDNVPTAMWFVEDYRLFTYWKAFAPFYDYFAVIQKEPFIEQLNQIGVEQAFYLPLAAQPDFHRPVQLTAVQRRKYGSDLSFLGAGYINRRRAFAHLGHYDFKIWGSDWEGESGLEPYIQRKGARIEPEEAILIFNATKINLNLHSSVQKDVLVPEGDFVNPRTFELAACEAFQLVDRRALLSELFEDTELVSFGSLKELKENIDYYLEHQQERDLLASKARQRVIAEHSYAKRMQVLLDKIAQSRSNWPEKRQGRGSVNDLPEELRAQLQDLLDRLGMSANTSFADLVQAVRQQQGRLSELETAILFLDEWQKQYS